MRKIYKGLKTSLTNNYQVVGLLITIAPGPNAFLNFSAISIVQPFTDFM
jgi:hypothetical protein